jgi:hypothetical protein
MTYFNWLHINFNCISRSAANYLASLLKVNDSLLHLNLANNGISAEEIDIIGRVIDIFILLIVLNILLSQLKDYLEIILCKDYILLVLCDLVIDPFTKKYQNICNMLQFFTTGDQGKISAHGFLQSSKENWSLDVVHIPEIIICDQVNQVLFL